MARLPYVDPMTASADVQRGLQAVPDLNIFKLVAQAEDVFIDFLRYGGSLLGATSVDPLLRELAILRVAALTPGAEYEWVQHEPIARDAGANDAHVHAARTGECDGVSGDDRLVLAFTEQLVRDASPDDETFAAMAQRFSPREIVELVLVIGQYMGLARLMATAQIDLDPAAGPDVIRSLRRRG